MVKDIEKVAFIGLGKMGMPIARNILKAGYDLAVYNRTPDKLEPLLAEGASKAASPREAASERAAARRWHRRHCSRSGPIAGEGGPCSIRVPSGK